MIGNFIKGLLFGATVGGAGGFLLAPQSGKETQKKASVYLNELTDATLEVNESITDLRQAVSQTQTAIEDTIPFVKTSIQKDIDAFKFQAEPRMQRVNEQIDQLKKDAEEFSTTNT
ncbi:MAG TPA: YtxH domain-containing protein [Candidatus Tetragenococcus pullicola]|nr:YtxH domain-containing protein [Candidatus Tetragenococcus pullicola]